MDWEVRDLNPKDMFEGIQARTRGDAGRPWRGCVSQVPDALGIGANAPGR